MTEQSINRNEERLQTVSRQDMTAEYQTCGQTETLLPRTNAMLNYNHVDKIGNDVAKTLCARDYKGLDNYGSNGVIEWKN